MRICPECDTRTDADRCPNDGRLTVDEERLKIRSIDPNIGLVVEDKYELIERLGRGGMGSVYKATHKETGGHVAIKVMRADMVEDEGAIRRFYIEAQNTHKLHHPNTVRVSDFGQTDDGVLFLVMEYVQGKTLRKVLKEEGRLAPSRAVHVINQVLKSLGEAHGHGVIHRDIKPDNVMLIDQFGEPDFVKVLDFGISRTMEGTGASTKGAIGTPKYMAPEQWRGERVDPRADLYSCGCVLYRMLTGRLPFEVEGKGSHQVVGYMTAHLNDAPTSLTELIPGVVPGELEDLVMSLLAKPAEDRPDDAQATLKQLRSIAKRHDLAEEVVAGAVSISTGDDSTMRTPTDSVPSEVLDGARRSSPPVPNASSTEFPGTARQTGSSTTSPLGVAVAIAATVLMMGGAAGWLILGDEGGTESLTTPRGTAAVNPSAAPAPSAPQAAPPTAFAEEAPAKRLLTITSTPTGATVRAPDGAVVGTTPMTLSRRDEKNLTILPDASERALDTVVLISEGYEAKTVSLDFPEKAGAEGTLAISLKVQVVVTVKADRRGVKVRVQGTTDGLGRTPFSWSVPGELAERIRAGEEVYLEYLTPTGPVAVALTPAHLDGGKGVKGLVRAKFTKSSSRRSKPAKSRKKAKPEKKKGWGW